MRERIDRVRKLFGDRKRIIGGRIVDDDHEFVGQFAQPLQQFGKLSGGIAAGSISGRQENRKFHGNRLPEVRIDFERIVRYYDRLLDSPLTDAQISNWRNAETQARGFAHISEIFPGSSARFTVYDVGCGSANFYDYLRRFYPKARYMGCDINARMIERVRERDPAIGVECRNILVDPPSNSYDFVIASGTFNQNAGNPNAAWAAYIRRMLRAMYRLARRGLAVGFLSTAARVIDPDDYYQDPEELLEFARSKLSGSAQMSCSVQPWHCVLSVRRPGAKQHVETARSYIKE
jgi:SAM-dependent methyltransferase